MYTQFRKLTLASGIALAMVGISGAAAADTVSQDITEARQETQIWTTYALSPYLRANDLKVSVHAGKATLSGKVEDDVNKDLAKQIALGVSGIKERRQPDRRADRLCSSEGEHLPQFWRIRLTTPTITAAVKSKLLWSKHPDGMVHKCRYEIWQGDAAVALPPARKPRTSPAAWQ